MKHELSNIKTPSSAVWRVLSFPVSASLFMLRKILSFASPSSSKQIDTAFEGMPLPVFITDIDGKIIRANQSAKSMFLGDGKDFPTNFLEFIPSHNKSEYIETLIQEKGYKPHSDSDALFYLARENGSHEVEVALKPNPKKASASPYRLFITALKNDDQGVITFLIAATNISKSKNQEKEILHLAEQNSLMARAMEEIDLGITISDGRQKEQPLIFCNEAFISMSGYSMHDILGHSCAFMQGPETDPKTIKALSEAIKNQEAITVEILNYTKNGQAFWNELSLKPIFSNNGSLRYYVGIQNDISERKRIEAMKKEFISTVSHELRTPLTSIHGSIGLMNDLYDGDERSEEKELLSVAYRNSERLKFLIDDILDTEKLDAGEMRFYPKTYPLDEIVNQGVELNKAYGELYEVEFAITNTIQDIFVHIDKQRIIQVFANLLSNAAKFSKDPKRVDISMEIIKGKTDSNVVRVLVKDYGEGVSEEFQEQIFQKFAQEDSSDVRKLPGTGLGLYISKKIMNAHNGDIGFETKSGEGATFYIDLPYSLEPQEQGGNV